MSNITIIDRLDEIDRRLVTLMGVMDIAEVYGESRTSNYEDDSIGHLAQTVKCMVADIRSMVDDTAALLGRAENREIA